MIELRPNDEALYDRLMSLKPEGLATRAWTINAGVGSGFFDKLAAGGKPRDGELPKILAVVGMTLAEFEGRRRTPSASAPPAPPALKMMPRVPRPPAEGAPPQPAPAADPLPPAGPDEAGLDEPASAPSQLAEATAEAITRWREARRQAIAAGLDTAGIEGVRLVTDLARLALDLERAPGRARPPGDGAGE